MAITPQPPAAIAVPNTLAPESAASVSAPNSSAASGVNPNLALYSEEFDNAAWAKSGATVTADDTIAPDLAATADKLAAGSTATIGPLARQAVTVTQGASYTVSAFVKSAEADFLQITFVTGEVSSDPRVNFDLSAGTIGTQDADIDSASIIPAGGDWSRISCTITTAGTTLTPRFVLIKSATDARGLTQAWTAGDGLHIWGAQIEQASGPTTYTKTLGEAVTAGAVVIPNTLTGQSAASPAVPNTLTAESAASAAVPNTLTAQSAAAPAVPNTLTADAALSPAVPNSLTATGQTALPRTLCPTVDINYAANLFAQNGAAVTESSLITFARASTATFINRQIGSTGRYEYFLDTALSGVQRIEYDAATGECLGALIEQASTNLCLRSEQLDNASWTKSDATISGDVETSPALTANADKLKAGSTATISPLVAQQAVSVISSKYTISLYAKRIEAAFLQVTFSAGHVANNPRVNFDLEAGVIGSQDSDIEAASIIPVSGGWFRLSCTVTAAGTILEPQARLIGSTSDTRSQANAWTAGDGLYIWGAQIEQAAIPTSYIPTTTAAVSRLADQVTIPVAGNVPANSHTIAAKVSTIGGDENNNRIYDIESTTGNVFSLYDVTNTLSIRHGAKNVELSSNPPKALSLAVAYQSDANQIQGYIDGELQVSKAAGFAVIDSSGVVGLGNAAPASSNQLNGHIKRFTIYDEALTAAEVAQL